MKLKFLIYFLIAYWVSESGELLGQARKYSYQRLTEDEGLAQNFVYGLIQDDRGFLWAGTGTGLSRYDGFEIKNFTVKDGLSGDFVTAVFRTTSGGLLFGHNQGGISAFDGMEFRSLLPDTLDTRIVSITEDENQNIWLATQSKGIILIDRKSAGITFLLPEILRDQVINLVYAKGGLLWVGTQEGIFFFRIKGTALTPIDFNLLPAYVEVTSISPHKSNSSLCWVGTAFHGIYLLESVAQQNNVILKRKIDLPEFSNDIVHSIDQDVDGDLWVGTRQQGIYHLNIGRDGKSIFKVNDFNKTTGFPVTSVNTLIVDRQGQIWASTMGDGLIKIYKEFFRYFPFAEKYGIENVRYIVESLSGFLIATDKGLLEITFHAQSDEYEVRLINRFKSESILSLYTDSKKDIWVGTENNGVFILPAGTKDIERVHISPEGDPLKVRLFEEDQKGNMWISVMAQGVYVLDANKKLVDHLTTADRFIHNDIFAIKSDSKGNMWFGTYGAGLAMMDSKKNLQLFSKDETIKAKDINDIDEDAEGNIWIATEGEGFFKYSDSKFTQVGSAENLVTPFIKGIQYDPQGRIWYSYRKGLGYFDLESEKKRHFTKQDGLVSGEAYSSVIMVDSKANKWFCNDYGVTLFENDTVGNFRSKLETYLTGIRIFFKDYPSRLQGGISPGRPMLGNFPALTLTHEENHITFDFAAIDLNRNGKIYYRHLLQEYDVEWTPPSTANSLTYTNLDPGEYVLKLQATDDLGAWVDPITEYSFSITPPYWKRTWFYFLQIVSLLSLFLITYFIGKKGISTKRYVLRLMLFSSFFITLEYVENFVDPLVFNIFGGAPIFRFFLNFILALLLLPVESLITHWLMDVEINKQLSEHNEATELATAPEVPATMEEKQEEIKTSLPSPK
ncbi:MAG: two-component regulator propeller domain-containing protein [Cyclobacteriaceae bacterium]